MDLMELFVRGVAVPAFAKRKKPTLDERFRAWLATHADVYAELERLALAELAAGAKRIGIGDLAERLRRDPRFSRKDGDPWKINNSYRSLIARKLVEEHPQLGSAIELRRRKGEAP